MTLQCRRKRRTGGDSLAVDLGSLVSEVKERIAFEELSGRTIAVDAYNTIYQFLSIIRQPDGTPLTDPKGRVTSHLSGIFYRVINLREYDIRPVFVFDGIPPHLKQRTIEARIKRRNDALEEWASAREKGLIEEARIHAMASTRINREIVESSKELLSHMGVPFIQAPSEGEAQAASMTNAGLTYAAASQDYDLLLFGSDVIIRNLTLTGRRKLPRKNAYVEIELERIFMNKFFDNLGINREQLIAMGMLVGTDFNRGIDKVGPKTALRIVREHRTLSGVVSFVREKYGAEFDADPEEVMAVFEKPEVRKMSQEEFSAIVGDARPDRERIISFMCGEHGFSEERIGKFIDRLLGSEEKKGQKGINSWM